MPPRIVNFNNLNL